MFQFRNLILSIFCLTGLFANALSNSCENAVCPTGYHCNIGSSGNAGCYKNGSTPVPDRPTCDNAICQKGYHCEVVNGSARCKSDNSESDTPSEKPILSGCLNYGYRGFGNPACPVNNYCMPNLENKDGACLKGYEISCYSLTNESIEKNCGFVPDGSSGCNKVFCPQTTTCAKGRLSGKDLFCVGHQSLVTNAYGAQFRKRR